MKKTILLWVSLCVTAFVAQAQENRTIDGSGNNPFYTDWGKSNIALQYVTPLAYTDGIAAPAGMDRPNPREISNALFAQPGLINDPMGLSDFTWVFGQFIDHDIILTENSPEFFPIPVPAGDPWFDPFNTGSQIIPMSRSLFLPGTGTSPANPRKSINQITAFIDASAVYGSTEERAHWLRSFTGGKLKTSNGNFLPYNTITGEFGDPIDPNAPHMADDVGMSPKLFVAGDVRANEQPLLLSFHTLFVREHNRLCDLLIVQHPDWDDEQLYQYARKMVSGYFQNIVYNEWLPAMGVQLPPYGGYQANVNPNIYNVFAAAAFRMGHTLLNSNILRIDEDGDVIPEGNLELRNGFFNPAVLQEGGLDPLFRGMAQQIQQSLDNNVINDVRNFLFGPPGSGGLDLVSININRGRERGLADFNTIRQSFGLAPYSTFTDIVGDSAEAQALSDIYNGDISLIDPWVGMLTEEPMPGALFGETIMKILSQQFLALRDGDRFYYMNDTSLTPTSKNEIRNTRLTDIIRRNTNVLIVQDNVFGAMSHLDVPQCEAPIQQAEVKGWVNTELNQPIDSVKIELFNGISMMPNSMTVNNGGFDFGDITTCYDYSIIPYKNDDADNGVTTLDLIKIQQHILHIQYLNSPYRIIAADANGSGHISTADLVNIRQVILHNRDNFFNNTSWRFVPEVFEFDDPTDPLSQVYPEAMMIDMHSIYFEENFIGIKIGDVDNTANPDGLSSNSQYPTHYVYAEDRTFSQGETVTLTLTAEDFKDIIGGQFTLQYSPTILQLQHIQGQGIEGFSDQNYNVMAKEGTIVFSWNAPIQAKGNEALVELTFLSNTAGVLSEALYIGSRYADAQLYTSDLSVKNMVLRFDSQVAQGESPFVLYQNHPNPVQEDTRIEFYMPEAAAAEMTFTDVNGRILSSIAIDAEQGYNAVSIGKNSLNIQSGIILYTLTSGNHTATKQMVFVQ